MASWVDGLSPPGDEDDRHPIIPFNACRKGSPRLRFHDSLQREANTEEAIEVGAHGAMVSTDPTPHAGGIT
jgi:hypothetical protein